jgi:transcriptional regulator with PAS, ATPase and Fis domain
MVNTTDSSVLTPAHLPDRLKPTQQSIAFNFNPPDSANTPMQPSETLADLQKKLIMSKLTQYGKSGQAKKIIAKEMGISLSSLYSKIRLYNLDPR